MRRHMLAVCLLGFATSAWATDNDGDGVPDAIDNCLYVANPDQRDTDADWIGNACDADIDNNCVVNFLDQAAYAANFFQSGDLPTDNNGDGVTNFLDFIVLRDQFFASPGPSALFGACNFSSELDATATSDSELQPSGLAIDNNMATRWESVHGVDPVVLTLDLGLSYALSHVDIHWEAANAGSYLIEASNDGQTWTALSAQFGGQFGDRTDTVTLSGSWRYVRMNGQTRSPGNVYGYSIWEMDVYGDVDSGFTVDVDADNDGVVDALDACPNTPPGVTVDAQGCQIVVPMVEVSVDNAILVGGAGSSRPGFALYVFDDDVGSSGSTCNEACAVTWPPLLLEDGIPNGAAGLSFITRDDGTSQITHQGRPLYFYANDLISTDRNGQGVAGVWWLVDYTTAYDPLFDAFTPLEPALQDDTPSALITRFSDRARDRHAREDQFQAYDHYLSFYWEHRTAAVEIIDPIGKGGNTITFNVTTQWPLSPIEAELRFFYRGLNTVAEYHNNGVMSLVSPNQYTRSVSWNNKTNAPLQVGDRLEFELSQFLQGVPNGRNNYYGTAFLYIVGQGLVPWEARGEFGNPATEREDSYPIPLVGWSGGDGTVSYQYSNEPDNYFLQMPTNLSDVNGQVFVEGRRVHHTDFGDGTHNEAPDNAAFPALAGALGNHYVNRSCVSCHTRNGRALPPDTGVALSQYVVSVSDEFGQPHPDVGAVLQPLSTTPGTEGSVQIASWTQSDGLRSPNFQFSGVQPQYFSARIAPQLVGLGLLEAIDEADLEALADPDDTNNDGISGRLRIVNDAVTGQARVGRFGWKASRASVRDQVASALNTDIGVLTSVEPQPDCGAAQTDCGASVEELSDDNLDKLTAYIALLGVRARRDLGDPEALAGEALFASAQCNRCHVETFETTAFHPHAELRGQTIHPYTDLLLHDMGDGLADTLVEDGATQREWRTPPLWGIGLTAGVSGGEAYLHDGRARSLHEAILWHGGEAETARAAYEAMSQTDKDALLVFLRSL